MHIFHPLGVPGRGNPHLKSLALFIPESGKRMGTFDTVLSLGAIPINKCTFWPPLADGFRATPQPRPGSNAIFFISGEGVVSTVHGGQTFWRRLHK